MLPALLAAGLFLSQAQTGQQTQTPARETADTPPATPPAQPVAADATEKPGAEEAEQAQTARETQKAEEAASAAAYTAGRTVSRMRSTTMAMREAAAKRLAERMKALQRRGVSIQPRAPGCGLPLGTPCGQADYFTTTPNWAFSNFPTVTPTSAPGVVPITYSVTPGTGIQKFVDTLAGLGPANHSSLGASVYIPIATPMANPWGTGGDYYEFSLIDYNQRMSSSLPVAGTQLRGYVDMNQNPNPAFRTAGDFGGHYLGPVVLAARDNPVRVKFTNNLAAGSFLFIPRDNTYDGTHHTALNGVVTPYSDNRATLHLHGGLTPWISDGTPHQWTVPVGEYATATYKRGSSTQFVPDMFFDATGLPVTTGGTNDPGPGSMTFFYTNAQSDRLMFYHDHAWGITRLNVYAGEAAGYVLHDPILDALIGTAIPNNAGVDLTNPALVTGLAGGLYTFGIPLVIQDKTFVPNLAQLTSQDPT